MWPDLRLPAPVLRGGHARDSRRSAHNAPADGRGVCIRLWRAIPRSESDVTFRHTAVTVRPAATADYSSHGSDAVGERVRSHAAGSAAGVVWECVVCR